MNEYTTPLTIGPSVGPSKVAELVRQAIDADRAARRVLGQKAKLEVTIADDGAKIILTWSQASTPDGAA